MAEPISSLVHAEPAPSFGPVARLAPPPPATLVAAELEARSAPGDIVIDLHGRGGWVARQAIARQRKAYVFESSPLTRLLAEVVLRPPDIRHFDAAVKAMAFQPRGHVGLHQALNDLYASRCATCGRPVVVEEFIWETDRAAPARKLYRCVACRDHVGGGEVRTEPTDEADAAHYAALDLPAATRETLLGRFPVLDRRTDLPEQLLALYTPRNLVAIEAIIERIERDLRAAPIEAALRLSLLHVTLAATRLNAYPGRVAALRISDARVRLPGHRQWREGNAWHLFNEGARLVRSFLLRLETSAGGSLHARLGEDLLALAEGSANVVLKRGSAALRSNAPAPLSPAATAALEGDSPAAVRLVLTQPPPRWTAENISFAYLATALVLGRDAATSLPLEALFGQMPTGEGAWEAAALRRSLAAVAPVLAPEARIVVMLEPGGADGLVAAALGGVGAGYRLRGALLPETGEEIGGTLEFAPPGHDAAGGSSPASGAHNGGKGALQLAEVEQAVSDLAVHVLQERGEPAPLDRLLGEVLVGLDRVGHLRRLVGTRAVGESETTRAGPAAEAVGLFGELPAVRERVHDEGAGDADADGGTIDWRTASDWRQRSQAQRYGRGRGGGHEPGGEKPPGQEAPLHSGSDHVNLLLELIMRELQRADHPSLVELEPGRWWLRKREEIEAARLPLSDRVEWAVFSLLSTAGTLTEQAFYDRIAGMFRGHDMPDKALVAACLESYRSATATRHSLRTDDDLQGRSAEHTELIGLLTEYGHRLGLRCWIGREEQKRTLRGAPLGLLLSEAEHRTYLPFVARGSVDALESTDCIWYLRGKATFLFEVEWTAMLGEPLLRRGPQIRTDDSVVRFLVLPPERAELARFKLDRSPLLRQAVQLDNWHFLKQNHLRTLVAGEEASLENLAPYLGLDPDVEILGEQLSLF
ncbi:MAG: hypothetical protein M3301_04680 [Chloroflexota bacterium]|nr:hypothetical protein [Chloroflexota bacterium]